MIGQGIVVGILYASGAVALCLLAVRWRRHSPGLAGAALLWAIVAYALPATIALLPPPVLDRLGDEPQPYVLLAVLWLFLLLPSLAGIALAQAHLRSRPMAEG